MTLSVPNAGGEPHFRGHLGQLVLMADDWEFGSPTGED